MNAAYLLKKIASFTKSRDLLHEVRSALDDLRRDADVDVINMINDN